MYKKQAFILFGLFVAFMSLAVAAHVAFSQGSEVRFRGNAWSAHIGADGVPRGVGWIVFSDEGTGSPYEINVSADGSGKINGAAWASISDPDDPTKQNYGWLLFSETSTCPDGNSGLCSPKLNRGSGELSGWARFVGISGPVGFWDGWVKLRNGSGESVKYGVCWGNSEAAAVTVGGDTYYTGERCAKDGITANGELTGMMWGGEAIGGWFVFTEGAPSGLLSITPPWPSKLAIFETMKFSANQEVSWLVGGTAETAVPGGNATVGTVSPDSTAADETTVYRAPSAAREQFIVAENGSGNRASVKIESTPPYRMNGCYTNSTTSLNIGWSALHSKVLSQYKAEDYPSHTFRLLGRGVPRGAAAPASLGTGDTVFSATSPFAQTQYTHESLSTSTDYYYQLRADFGPAQGNLSTSTAVYGPCNIFTLPLSDTPSRTKAFGIDTSRIAVNWKDNTTTTGGYYFEVQRITLNPASSTQFVATTTKAEYVKFNWTNITTSTPFYHELERSTTTAAYRFNRNTRAFSGQLDGSLSIIDVTGWNDLDLPTSPQYVNYNDTSVREATTYYYRVRTCSMIDPTKAYTSSSELVRGGTEKPEPVCSKYATPLGPGQVVGTLDTVSTTTLPYAPSNATSSASWDGSAHSIFLQWKDNSKRETGYRIVRNGVVIDFVPASAPDVSGGTLSYTDLGTNNSTGTLSALNPGTRYDYTIQAYYDIPPEHGAGRVYSEGTTAGTYTWFRVLASVSGDGNITGDVNCSPGSCVGYFPWYETPTVTLSASADDGSYFDGWTNVSCQGGNSNPTCTFSRGNTNPRANFENYSYTLSVSVTGNGRVTGSGINCPGTCSATPEWGDWITLAASSTGGSTFTGWSGACTGTSTCNFRMYGDRSVGASFSGGSLPPEVRSVGPAMAGAFDAVKGFVAAIFAPREAREGTENRASALDTFVSGVESVVDSMKFMVRGIRDQFTKVVERIERATERYIAESTTPAEGKLYTGINLDKYFETFKASSTLPSYINKDLNADTVYMYRVRAVYTDGSGRITPWDLSAAAKTLSNTGGTNVTNHGVCVQNSYCDFSIRGYRSTTDATRLPPVEESEEQCTTNAQCRDVGRGGQTYQER